MLLRPSPARGQAHSCPAASCGGSVKHLKRGARVDGGSNRMNFEARRHEIGLVLRCFEWNGKWLGRLPGPKPRRGGMFIVNRALNDPFLFFSGAALAGLDGTGTLIPTWPADMQSLAPPRR